MAGNGNALQIGAVVDTASLNQGFDESRAATQAFVQNLNVAFADGRAASLRAFNAISDDVKQMAASVTEDQARVAAATREVAEANADLRRTLVLIKDGAADAELSQSLYAAALDRVAAATATLKTLQSELAAEASKAAVAVSEEAVALNEVAVSSHAAVSGVQATSAAIRSLEGNAGLRAVENFISKTLGLGPLMQKVFPLIGALAFGDILLNLGEKIYDVGEAAVTSAEKTTEAFEEQHAKSQINIDDLTIQADKIQDNIDKISGHPGNGLQTSLDEARKYGDKLLDSLRADRKELDALLKEHEVGAFGSALTGVASTGEQKKQMMLDQLGLTKAFEGANADFNAGLASATSLDQIQQFTDKRNQKLRESMQSQIDTYKQEKQRLKDEEVTSQNAPATLEDDGSGVLGASSTRATDNSTKIANVEGRAKQLQDMLNVLNAEQRVSDLEKEQGAAKQGKENGRSDDSAARKAAEEQRKADEASMRALEAHATQERNIFNASAAEEQRYWQTKLALFVEGSTQYDAVLRKIEAADAHAQEQSKKQAEAQVKDATEATKAMIAATTGSSAFLKQIDEDIERTGERWVSYWASVAKGAEGAANATAGMQEETIRTLLATGGITALGAAQAEAAIHVRQNRAEIEALNEQLKRLQDLSDKSPKGPTGESLAPKLAAQIQQVKNQIAETTSKGNLQGAKDLEAQAAAIAAPWIKATDTIETSWMTAQRSMLTGSKSFAQAMTQMASQMAMSVIEDIERAAFTQIKTDIMVTARHAAEKSAQTAMDAGSATAGLAISKATTATQGEQSAKLVFKNVYAQVSGWPVIGPVAAPILASAAFAAVAAFEQGTMMVPREGAAILHPGEAVLTNPNASMMRDALSGKLGGGGDTFHAHLGGNTFNGGGPGGQGGQSDQMMIRQLKKLHREGQFKFAKKN